MQARNSQSIFVFGDSICAANVDKLSESLERYFAHENTGRLILDLGRVRLCDSCGLKLFINLQRKAASAGKQFILYRPDTILKDILDNTNLSHLFTIIDAINEI